MQTSRSYTQNFRFNGLKFAFLTHSKVILMRVVVVIAGEKWDPTRGLC